jgi:NifB/MoaA-like Fe-S oxidoreductase
MTPIIEAHVGALAGATGAEVEVHGVRNEFFGESVTVAGLLAGRDLLAAAAGAAEGDVILIPEEALNHDRLFVDSYPLERLRAELAPARVVPGLEITAALRSL